MFFLLITRAEKENHLAVSRSLFQGGGCLHACHRRGHTLALAWWDGEESGEGGLTSICLGFKKKKILALLYWCALKNV